MNPQNIPTGSENINGGIENTSGLKRLAKDTRSALSIVALSVLQACTQSHAETPAETSSSDPIIMADASGDPDYQKALEGTINLDGKSSGSIMKVSPDGEMTIETAQLSQTIKPTPASYAVPNVSEESQEFTIPELQLKIAELETKGVDENLSGLDDSEFDQLMAYQDKLMVLQDAKTEAATKRAEESGKRAEESGKRAEESGKTRKAMEDALNALGGE